MQDSANIPPTDGIIVSRSRSKDVKRVLFSLFCLIVSVMAFRTPFSADEGFNHKIAHFFTAYLGPPFFLGLLILSIAMLRSKAPVLVINDEGIWTSVAKLGMIHWSEIARIEPVQMESTRFRNSRYLGIIPHDLETLAARYSASKAQKLRFSQESTGAAVAISEQILPMRIEELRAQINDYRAAIQGGVRD